MSVDFSRRLRVQQAIKVISEIHCVKRSQIQRDRGEDIDKNVKSQRESIRRWRENVKQNSALWHRPLRTNG